ncbi:serine carboxypeptidase-like 45-like, partial [Trifolium medium]|nr:serine carboxypeptidase-like 45-like [Trifolium medium]
MLGTLVKAGVRVLAYSCDQDSVIPLTGTRTLLSGLAKDLALNTAEVYKVWLESGQVGGWTEVYGEGLLTF